MIAKIKDFFASSATRIRFFLSMLAAFAGTQAIALTSTPVFAEESDNSSAFSTHVDTHGNAIDVLAKIMNEFVAPFQNLGAVLLILAAVFCGIKIGVSAMGDPRSRYEAIVGIFFIIVGAVVIIHVRSLVGMVVGLSNKSR